MDGLADAYALLGPHPDAAEARARAGLAVSPDHGGWLQLLALSLASQGRAAEAREGFAALAAREPEVTAHWLNLGNACLDLALPAPALEAFEHAAGLGASGVALDLGLGLALLERGRVADALPRLQAAHAADPAPDTTLALARCLLALGRQDEAADCVAGLGTAVLDPRQAESLSWILAQAGRDADAEAVLAGVLARHPAQGGLRVQYALLLERLNRRHEARAQLEHPAVAEAGADPNHGLARGRLARRDGKHAAALAGFDAAAAVAADPATLATLHFERARTFDAMADSDAAMAALAIAHDQAAAALAQRYPAATAEAHRLDWLDERLDGPAPVQWRDPRRDGLPADPWFLVGFPRSGTTLLEGILDSHPMLASLDERPALEAAITALKAFHAPGADAWEPGPDAIAAARRAYWGGVDRYVPPPRPPHLLDKYPLHLGRLPYIARLFPEARIVLALRHPCDCVLSCYMQDFGINGSVLSFGSLDAAARTYAQIMGYWEDQRPRVASPVHAVRHEDLLDDFDGSIGAVLDGLGLPPDPAVHAYREQLAARQRRIRTPSYWQVVEPLRRDGVDRWRRYRRHFSPDALRLLAPFAARYGYAIDEGEGEGERNGDGNGSGNRKSG